MGQALQHGVLEVNFEMSVDGEFHEDFRQCFVCGVPEVGWTDLAYYPDPEDEALFLDERTGLKERLLRHRKTNRNPRSSCGRRHNPETIVEMKTLEQLCVDSFLKRIDRIVQMPSNPFEKLSNMMRNALLLQLSQVKPHLIQTSSVGDLHKFIQMLLNEGTTSFDFENWLAWAFGPFRYCWVDEPRRLENLLEVISKKCPKIETVKTGGWWTNLSLNIEGVQPMLSLKELVIGRAWMWSDTQVQMLAEKCPNLVRLRIRGCNISDDGLTSLSNLKNLEFLSFSGCIVDQRHRYNIALQKMPWLRGIHCPQNSFLLNLYPSTRGVLALENLHVPYELPERIQVPHLETLKLTGPLHLISKPKTMELLSSYAKLQVLRLADISARDLDKVVSRVGTQLTELGLDGVLRPFDLEPILRKCPNLITFKNEEVEMNDMPFPYSSCEGLDLSKIQTFECEFSGQHAPLGLLANLLYVEKVQSITLNNFQMRPEELQLFDCVDKKRLQFLKNFVLCDLKNTTLEDLEALGQMTKFVICSAPRLKKVEIDFLFNENLPDNWYSINWHCKSVCKFTNLVNFTDPLL